MGASGPKYGQCGLERTNIFIQGGGKHFYIVGGGQIFCDLGGGGRDDVDEEMYVSEVNFLVSEANTLSAGARIFRGLQGPQFLVYYCFTRRQGVSGFAIMQN